MNSHESRALMIGLENEYKLPKGSLQAIGEQLTGWGNEQSLLPPHRERSQNRYQEHIQSAQRLREKLNEFDGILPLAFDAYFRGDKKTRQSLSGLGFDETSSRNVYRAMARMPKYGAPELTGEDFRSLSKVFGEPNAHDIKLASTQFVPDAIRPNTLTKTKDGKYRTGDNFFDAVMYIESKGNTNAVSVTGATGLFQFTKGTGKRYGLITQDGKDFRKDPEANFRAMQQLTKDNANDLKKAGIELTPTNLYLAHQQGVGGAIEIIRAMKQGREVSPQIRTNMNHNNGRGKTPAQFYAFVDSKVKEALELTKSETVGEERFIQEVPTQASYDINLKNTDDISKKSDDLAIRANALARLQRYFQNNGDDIVVPKKIRAVVYGIMGDI